MVLRAMMVPNLVSSPSCKIYSLMSPGINLESLLAMTCATPPWHTMMGARFKVPALVTQEQVMVPDNGSEAQPSASLTVNE